ncbi:MAG: hypothetical protein KME46_26595, partial [Brasilonema angustatum HA4187-MV1]|nr:hypothetical protein [Brasilonema angustatum HA4187-MV1]
NFSSPFLTPPIRAKRHPVRHLGRVVEVLGLRYLSSFFGEGIVQQLAFFGCSTNTVDSGESRIDNTNSAGASLVVVGWSG